MRAFGGGREALGFELVGKPAELVEIYARPEAERMRYGPGHGATTCLARLSEAGADRPIDGLLEAYGVRWVSFDDDDLQFAPVLLLTVERASLSSQGTCRSLDGSNVCRAAARSY